MFLSLLTGEGRDAYGHILTQLVNWLSEGRLTVLQDEQAYTFDQVSDAHQWAESGKATGKVAITKE